MYGERAKTMISQCSCEQTKSGSPHMDTNSDAAKLTILEFAEIVLYTVQKINNYPRSFGKTVENYFHLLFPDEVKAYQFGRTINHKFTKQIRSGC